MVDSFEAEEVSNPLDNRVDVVQVGKVIMPLPHLT
jgi:hypothetical protein